MGARKRTFSKNVQDFFRNTDLQDEFNISSYSSSEEENEGKKFQISVIASQNLEESLKISVDQSFSLCNISTTFDESLDDYSSNSSPVLAKGRLETLSPILKCSSSVSADLSPILGRKQISSVKRRKNLCRRFHYSETISSLPEKVAEVQKFDSPSVSSTTSSNDNLRIGSFSSDNLDNTKVVINSVTTDASTSKSLNEKPLYQESSPKRKKKYKKDGIAFQLAKALDKQKTDFSIFRHELFLSKTNERLRIDESLKLIFKINKIWKEFGVTMIYCDCLNLRENTKLVDYFRNDSRSSERAVDLEKCLVSVGCNVTHSLNIKVDAKLKAYLPFKSKVVNYNNVEIYCHFNVFKIFSEK